MGWEPRPRGDAALDEALLLIKAPSCRGGPLTGRGMGGHRLAGGVGAPAL